MQFIQKAKDISLDYYHFNPSTTPSSRLNIESVFFEMQGESNDRYRSSVTLVPSSLGSYTLVLLQDIEIEIQEILSNSILFLGFSLLGIICLGLFSWWFSGRAIIPIEVNQRKQVEFIAAASHELKAPLSVIQSNTSVLEHLDNNIYCS